MQISDLDPNYHPHRIHFTHNKNNYLATFKEPNQVFLFLFTGEQEIKPKGAIDCTKVPDDKDGLGITVFNLVHKSLYRVLCEPGVPPLDNLRNFIDKALVVAKEVNQSESTRSRELSHCITKLEESLMWLEKALAHSEASGIG